MNTVIIGLGSNIHPEKNIQQAKQYLRRDHNIIAESIFVTTKPIGFLDQPDFLNGAVLLETPLNQNELTEHLKNIEKKQGRMETNPKHGPRTIDLDILVWNNKIIDPDVYHRDFLQNSINELAPQNQFFR